MDQKAQNLAEVILSGQASEEERGLALRNLQTGISASMVAGMNVLHKSVQKAFDLYLELDDAYMQKLREELDSNILTKDEIRIERNALESRIYKIVNLERQVTQGKSLFPEDSLSESDRKVLRLLSSIKTEEERDAFMRSIENFFKEKNSLE